jgi:hypothetical protein
MSDDKQLFEQRLAALAQWAELTSVWPVKRDGRAVQMRDWSLRRTSLGIHVCGYNMTHGEGRVSSALQSFDRATGVCVSSSGNRYALSGKPGTNLDAEHVWGMWCRRADVEVWDDVTAQVLQQGAEADLDAPSRLG